MRTYAEPKHTPRAGYRSELHEFGEGDRAHHKLGELHRLGLAS